MKPTAYALAAAVICFSLSPAAAWAESRPPEPVEVSIAGIESDEEAKEPQPSAAGQNETDAQPPSADEPGGEAVLPDETEATDKPTGTSVTVTMSQESGSKPQDDSPSQEGSENRNGNGSDLVDAGDLLPAPAFAAALAGSAMATALVASRLKEKQP